MKQTLTYNRRKFARTLLSGLFVPAFPVIIEGATIITERLETYGTQEAITLNNSSTARLIPVPNGWSTIRVGLRYHFTNQNSFVSPAWAIGLCHGTTNLFNSATTDHFVGAFSNNGFSYNGPGCGSVYFGVAFKAAKRVGTTTTTSASNIAGDTRHGSEANTSLGGGVFCSDPTVMFVDITSGSPNYSVNLWYYQAGSARTFTPGEFSKMVNEFTTPTYGGNFGLTHGTPQSIAVNEGTDGVLNAITAYWNQSTVLCEICDFDFAVF